MKLVEALRIGRAPQPAGKPFNALLACGFTPLHLETAILAHLRLALPDRAVFLKTGPYGDVAAALTSAAPDLDAATIALEWADLDPRLGWRSMAPVSNAILADARARLDYIESAIDAIPAGVPVALSLPTLPFPPVLGAPQREVTPLHAALWQMLYEFAARTRAIVVQPGEDGCAIKHDLRSDLMTGFPYAFDHAQALAFALVRGALPIPPKKGLIIDLDETLWGGVLGDDGVAGVSWELDRHTQFHALFQQVLNVLAQGGTLIGVASKNDPQLAQEALERADLVVDRRHLFPVEANWEPKIDSIRRILDLWNIGEESVAFMDDSAFELEQVKQAFPLMECVQFRRDDAALLVSLRDMFAKRRIGVEDSLRVAGLRESGSLQRATGTLESILESAGAKVIARWGKNPFDVRAFELVNKTNQFNLNGARYTESEWMRFLAEPATHVLAVEYEDRFGKLGKIAVLAGRERGGAFDVATWVMSCRAFSRRIEYQCIRLLLDRWPRVTVQFQPTARNGPLRDFLSHVNGTSQGITREEFAARCPRLFHEMEVCVDE
jgi:FkbH-like protein